MFGAWTSSVLYFVNIHDETLLVSKIRYTDIAERACDTLRQLKCCQLLHSCTKNRISKSLQ